MLIEEIAGLWNGLLEARIIGMRRDSGEGAVLRFLSGGVSVMVTSADAADVSVSFD